MVLKDKIPVSNLKVGMYICKLDRPWLDTPFPFQGFYLRTKGEIEDVQRFCKHVFIDAKKGTQTYKQSEISKPSPLLVKEKQNRKKAKHVVSSDLRKIALNIGKYDEKTKSFKREIKTAKTLFQDLTHSIEQLSFDLRVGKGLNLSHTKKVTKKVVDSVIKNPNTMVWLSRLREKGDYTYNHSLRSSVLATVFGRHLGLNEKDLVSLASGVLLADIGKTKIKRKLLNKTEPLNNSEKIMLRSHVEIGVEMLANQKVDHSTLVIVETHHERYNGTGYPYGLVGREIPFFGQIAGLVDLFDAITTKKPYGKHITSAQAMDWLYTQKDKLFSGQLIEDFVQAIGLYPAGTLVELTDSSIGLVVSHNPQKRLRPEVFLLKDAGNGNQPGKKAIDLSKRAFLSKVDRPMVKRALLPEDINLSTEKLAKNINDNKKLSKILFG